MSINRCRMRWLKRVEHRPPLENLVEPRLIEQGIEEMEGMLQ